MIVAQDEHWYVVLTNANRESDAAHRLKRQGYAVFFPRRWVTWSHRGKTTSELRPLLSRYIFAAVGEGQSVGAINDTDGVARVLTMQGEAYEIPAVTMWNLRRSFDPDGVEPPGMRTAKHMRKMLRGIKGEVAAELLAALERIDDNGRFRVSRHSRELSLVLLTLPAVRRKPAENSHFNMACGATA
jgi:transcription antitermination factor NusG